MVGPEALVLRLTAAAVLGGVVGFERERVESAAGLRTHALVCVGATLIMLVSMFGFQDAIHAPDVVLDPSRAAAQIVSGIGFLGAGVIIFRREIIRGLTTAASLWVVAGIGMAVGGGLFLAAVIATVLSLGILAVMKPLERRWALRRRPHAVRVTFDPNRIAAQRLLTRLADVGLKVRQADIRFVDEPGKSRMEAVVDRTSPEGLLSALHAISAEEGVRDVRSSVSGMSATQDTP